MKYPHVTDKRPMTPAEAQRGMQAIREWPEDARVEVLRLPASEATVMLMLAGELGAMPEDATTRSEDRSAS